MCCLVDGQIVHSKYMTVPNLISVASIPLITLPFAITIHNF